MSTPMAPFGTTNRAQPAQVADATESAQRHWNDGSVATVSLMGSKLHALADQGSYFTACNATPGTALASVAAEASFAATKTLLLIRNGTSATKRICMDFIKLQVAAAGTNGTNYNLVLTGDKNGSRYSSGGTALTAVNTNLASTTSSGVAELYFGAVTTTAATSAVRTLWHSPVRTVIKVVGDQYLLNFGAAAGMPTASTIMAGTAQASFQLSLPPVVLGPGDSMMLHEWAASQDTAATYEVSMGWWEI